MKKKIVIISLLIIIACVFAVYYGFKSKDAADQIKNLEGQINGGETWNPYSEDVNFVYTLEDFIISANKGNHIVKMTVTLDFVDESGYKKFKGYAEIAEEKEEDETSYSPMEHKIRDTIGQLMLDFKEDILRNPKTLKNELIKGINKDLGFEEEIINSVYIENFVVQ